MGTLGREIKVTAIVGKSRGFKVKPSYRWILAAATALVALAAAFVLYVKRPVDEPVQTSDHHHAMPSGPPAELSPEAQKQAQRDALKSLDETRAQIEMLKKQEAAAKSQQGK